MKKQQEVVTFKVEAALLEALKGVRNRSEFIRNALLQAMESQCPLCKGTGILTPEKKKHWLDLKKDHSIQECGECHEITLVCHKE